MGKLAIGFSVVCLILIIYMMTLPTIPHKAPPLYYDYMTKWMNHE